MASKRIGGIVYVKVDGKQIKTKGGFEVPISNKKRATVMADDGPAGYSEAAHPNQVKGNILITPDFPLSAITGGTDLTITVELANGMTYVLTEAFLAEHAPLKSDSGECEMTFEGMNGEFQ